MPKIESMYMRRGRPERFVVTLEDEQQVVLTPETVLKFSIAPDKDFSDEMLLQMLEQDSVLQAKDQAMRYLSRRQHSRLELVRKMREKGYRYDIINRALDDLEKIDLVNDKQFAKMYIQDELRLRPCGKILLIQKLKFRGIPPDLYEPLLDELFPQALEQEMAVQLAEKFVKSHSRLKGNKLKEKLVRFLLGKGFLWEQINEIETVRQPPE